MEQNQKAIATINHQRAIKFREHSVDLSISCWNNWPLSRGYFGSWGHNLVAELPLQRGGRLKQESRYRGLSGRTNKSGRCREEAVRGGSTALYDKGIWLARYVVASYSIRAIARAKEMEDRRGRGKEESFLLSPPLRGGARVAFWWEHSPPTNVVRVQLPALTPYVGWVCCGFSR